MTDQQTDKRTPDAGNRARVPEQERIFKHNDRRRDYSDDKKESRESKSRYLKNGKKKPLKQRISEGFYPEIA